MNRTRSLRHGHGLHRWLALAMKVLPLASVLFLSFLPAITVAVPTIGLVRPYYGLAVVFYWSIYRTDLLPLVGLFVLGIVYDFGSGGLVGLTPLLYLLLRGVIGELAAQFRLQGFLVNWGFWLLVVVLAMTIDSVVNSLVSGRQVSIMILAVDAIVSWLLFPPIFMVMEWLRQKYLGDIEAGL
ncbi:MAG: rod shape-determining protein MreD [Candidatus Pacebacteria bacterium]|nr:rod shape-determining protein MreD [Candidatus Paceibacterota bacterium]